ncbi:MAG: DEAD/DEAH box helicase [Methanobacteriota archaeon]|nr:MAG: DEAD/DEAH box helicase [Euryarchaeota archaeon]
MSPVEIIKVPAVKDTEFSVERPIPKKGDREIAQQICSTLAGASKLRRMMELVKEHRSTLIFVNTRQMAETLASRFRVMGVKADIHHSSLSREAREAVEDDFRRGRLKALICTSSLELGIDIGTVDLVIQYGSPRQVTRLVQRVGRSGHGVKRRSKGVIIADNPDDLMEAAVIVRRAKKDELEDIAIFEKPYDVLAHQIAGLLLDLGEMDRERCYRILKKTGVFRDLTEEEFDDVVKVLAELRLLWIDGDRLRKSRKTRQYYYENISTIPDEKRYFVKNSVSNSSVGVLDEAFVAGLEEGDLIIFKAMPWHVVAIEGREVLLEPVGVVAGEVPRWVGEEIPVEYAVAREAGSLRRRGFSGYDADTYTRRLAMSAVRKQRAMGLPIPHDRRILVELFQGFLVINSVFGLKVNETLGRVFSALLSAKTGHSVGLRTDPYRIIIQAKDVSTGMARELFQTQPSFIRPLLSVSLKRTGHFKWRFIHVARRFGAISPEVDLQHLGLPRIIEAWEDSPIYRETLKDIFTSNLDVAKAAEVLTGVQKGRIALDILRLKGPSPISEIGMAAFSEFILPERAEKMILRALKNRIQSRRITLLCAYCGKWHESFLVRNIPGDIRCGRCGARMLAPITYKPDEAIKVFRKYKSGRTLSKEEKKEVRRIQDLGGLFLSYGPLLCEVLAARGVGGEVGKRILRDSSSEEELYRNILKSERDYARTKRFWD